MDKDFKQVYDVNRRHILRAHTLGKVVQSYNFPTENLSGGVDEVMKHLEQIYKDQINSFKVNINLGFILRDKITNELRYFIPFRNSYIFEKAPLINNSKSLTRLRRKIEKLNLLDYVFNNRPNSRFVPEYITNIHYDIALTNYALGSPVELSEHILSSQSILTFQKNPKTGKPFEDNLCFFRCLARHFDKETKSVETTALSKFQEWLDFKGIKAHKFKGITLKNILELENCFQISINVYQLLETKAVIVHYSSIADFEETLHLDLQNGHLSFISNFSIYAQRFQCQQCNRLFRRCSYLNKHRNHCSKRTKNVYPGGFYCPNLTIFDELEKFNIHVPHGLRFFEHFITFDFESVLKQTTEYSTEKLQ